MSFVTSVHPSVGMNNSAPTGRIFLKFSSSVFFSKYAEKIQFSLKYVNNNGQFNMKT
jgi:hypothetical protein